MQKDSPATEAGAATTKSSATSATTDNAAETWPLEANARDTGLYAERQSKLPPAEELARALAGHERRPGAEWAKAGDLIGSRLNLNILRSTGVAAQTLHQGNASGGHQRNKGFWKGRGLGVCGAVELSNAFFNVNQIAREEIASGEKHKTPMASVDGRFVTDAPQKFDGVEVSFNPKKSHLFTDSLGRAIRFAELAVVCGHRVFVSGRLVWHDEASAPKRAGDFPSSARVRPGRDSESLGAFDAPALEKMMAERQPQESSLADADASGSGVLAKKRQAKKG